jgi:beta-glucanase (GH16 family)
MRKVLVLLAGLALACSVTGTASGRAATTAHSTKARSDACGPRPAKPGGGLWACSFHDEFGGSTLNPRKWVRQTNFVTGTRAQHACYRGANVTVANGQLNLVVRREHRYFRCVNTSRGAYTRYSAGSVMTYHLFSQAYGRFQARIRVSDTSQPGLHEAFWLWPDDRYSTGVWPAAGEIDVAELYSGRPDRAVPYLHYTADDNGGAIQGVNFSRNCVAHRGVFNTYTLTWSATRLAIAVNGRPCLVNTSGDPAFRKRYIIALTSGLGTGPNAWTSATLLPSTMNVDYVRVWR